MKSKVILILSFCLLSTCSSQKKEIDLGTETRDVVLESGRTELRNFYKEFLQKITDKYYSPYYNDQIDILVLDFRNDQENTTILSKIFSDFLYEQFTGKKGLRHIDKVKKEKAYAELNLTNIGIITSDLGKTLLNEYNVEIVIDGEVILEKSETERIIELHLRAYETKSGIKILGQEKRFNFERIAQTIDLESYLQTILVQKQSLYMGHLKITEETKLAQFSEPGKSADKPQNTYASLQLDEDKLNNMKFETRVSIDNQDFFPDEQGIIIDRSIKSGPYELGIIFTLSFPFENNLIFKKQQARYLIDVKPQESLDITIENVVEQPDPVIRVKAIITKPSANKDDKKLVKEFINLKELPLKPAN